MGLDNGVVYFHWKPGTKYQCTAKSDSADKNLQLSLRTQNVHIGYKCANGLQSTNSFKTKSSNTKGKEQFWVSSSYSPLPQVLNSLGEIFDCRKLKCMDELKDGKETKLRVFAQLLDYERQVLMPAVKYCFKMRVLGDRLFLRRQIWYPAVQAIYEQKKIETANIER